MLPTTRVCHYRFQTFQGSVRQTISPTSLLPIIIGSSVIDGTTQPASRRSTNVLNGLDMTGSYGLSITAGNSTRARV